MASDPRAQAERLLTRTEDFAALGLGDLAALARCCARDLLDALDRLEAALAAAQAARDRHDAYVAYHQAHCFRPDGTTIAGTTVEPYRG